MLTILVKPVRLFNDVTQEFYRFEGGSLVLEHSLISVSKWEAAYKKSFLSSKGLTHAETVGYIRAMTIGNPDPIVYSCITDENIDEVNAYILDSMTATTFHNLDKEKPNREIITSEVIYYWMVTLQIPLECEKWHLNRLLTLINVCNLKNRPAKKQDKRQAMSSQRALNAARKASLGTRG